MHIVTSPYYSIVRQKVLTGVLGKVSVECKPLMGVVAPSRLRSTYKTREMRVILEWQCESCKDIQLSDTIRTHHMDYCKCGESAVDLEDGYQRDMGKVKELKRTVTEDETTITPRALIELGFEEIYQDVDYGEPGYIFYSHEIKGVGFYSVDTDDKDFHVRMDNSDYEIRNLRKLRDLILSLNEVN